MNGRWLMFCVCAIFIVWIQHWILALLFSLLVSAFYWKRYSHGNLFFILLLMLFQIRSLPMPLKEFPKEQVVMVKEIKKNYVIAKAQNQDILLYNLQGVAYGDIIEWQGSHKRIEAIHNMNSFHFPAWLKRKGILYEGTVISYRLLEEGNSIRHDLYQCVQEREPKQKQWLLQMIYGIEGEEEISYFVMSSGLHISFLMYLLQRILLLRMSTRSSSGVCFALIGVLGYFTVFSSSILRILCFQCIRLIIPSFEQKDQLGLSVAFVLCLFPYMAFEMALILPLSFRFLQIFNLQKRSKHVTQLLILLPIQFYYFHKCNVVQLYLFRYLRILYAFVYLLALLSLCSIGADVCYQITSTLLTIMEQWTLIGFTLYYTPALWWLCGWGFNVIQYITFRNKRIVISLGILLMLSQFGSYLYPFGEVLVMDVGQGDCILIRLPFHQGVLLIDVIGNRNKNVPKDIIIPILKGKGIRYIDKIILTHDDFDHSGGLKQLADEIEIGEVITKKQATTMLGPLQLQFLLDEKNYGDSNENSLITYMELFGLHYLFMGDAGKSVEEDIMKAYPKLKIDVLKVGHHGSKTSSSQAFIHQLQPRLSLISSGRNNRYGHPHKEVLKILKDENSKILDTARSGDISIKFSKYFSYFMTAENEFGIIHVR